MSLRFGLALSYHLLVPGFLSRLEWRDETPCVKALSQRGVDADARRCPFLLGGVAKEFLSSPPVDH